MCSELLCDSGIHANPVRTHSIGFECLGSQSACRMCQRPPIASNSIALGPVMPTVQLVAKPVRLSTYIYLENAGGGVKTHYLRHCLCPSSVMVCVG